MAAVYDWNEANLTQLDELWGKGVSSTNIAIRLFGTKAAKNAVIGKARRRNLAERGSPIVTKGSAFVERITEARAAKVPDIERMLHEGHSIRTVRMAMQVNEDFVRHVRDAAGIPAAKPGGIRRAPMPIIPSPRQNVIAFPPAPPLKPKPPAPVYAAPTGHVTGLVRACCWPMGDPKSKSFRFCEARPVVLGRSYCEAHCKKAYIKRNDVQEVA